MSLSEGLAAAQEWWRGVGVEYDYLDEAKPWLKDKEVEAAPAPRSAAKVEDAPPPEPEKPAIQSEDLPQDLGAFHEWWCDQANAIPGATGRRLMPRGDVGAQLMVIVPSPEMQDRSQLLEGAQGVLVANILRALNVAQTDSYLASALPSAMAEPDWNDLHLQGLGTVLAHHIGLAQPKRVLLLGRGLPLLLGHGADAAPENLVEIDSSSGKLPVLTSFAPDRLLGHARQRKLLWHRLLEWME